MNRTPTVVALAGIAVTALAAGAAAAGTSPPSSAPIGLGPVDPTNVRLDGRARLSADLVVDDIPTGALSDPANGRTPPYPGQVVPGFSGVVANDDGTYWAMPDNGFGTIENSTDCLLRLYHVTPDGASVATPTEDRRGAGYSARHVGRERRAGAPGVHGPHGGGLADRSGDPRCRGRGP